MARTPAPGTRDLILSTASRLFYEHGVRAVGVHQVITEAGTGKNALYTHFPTKAELVAGYLEATSERRLAAARHAREAAGSDPADQLVAVVAEVASSVRRRAFRGCAFRNYLAEFPDEDEPGADPGAEPGRRTPARVAREHLAAAREEIAEPARALLAGQDPARAEELTERLRLIIDGVFQQASYRDRTDAGLEAGAAAVDLARALVRDAAPASPST